MKTNVRNIEYHFSHMKKVLILSLALDFIIAFLKGSIPDINQNQRVMPLIYFLQSFLLRINSHLPKPHSMHCSHEYKYL